MERLRICWSACCVAYTKNDDVIAAYAVADNVWVNADRFPQLNAPEAEKCQAHWQCRGDSQQHELPRLD